METKGMVFVISAPSGTGKSTVAKLIRKKIPSLTYSVSFTTRQLRKGEKEGIDYYYISQKDFKNKILTGEMIEWTEIYGNLYGTSIKIIKKGIENGSCLLLDIDVEGAMFLKKTLFHVKFIFLEPPSLMELERRLRLRNSEDESNIQMRLKNAQKEIKYKKYYDYSLINRDLDETVTKIVEIIKVFIPSA